MISHRRALAGTLAVVAAAGAVAVTPMGDRANAMATAGLGDRGESRPADASTARLKELMRKLTTTDGAPGALLEVRDRRGRKTLTSGVADVTSRAHMRGDVSFRIGSMTKPFVSTVVLQLVAEHRIALDAPVERYLPGVIRGNGNDGRKISVRELLQHTSGLPDVVKYLDMAEVVRHPLTHYDADEQLKIALAHGSLFEPGKSWSYSNTNYLVAAMIIKRVTGRGYDEEIRRRIIKPLGLRQTRVPADSPVIPGPHPRGYVQLDPNAPLTDITALNPSVASSSGGMISSTADLNTFLGALVRGRLLPPAELRQMMRTRSTGGSDGRAYGLGLESRPLPCGGVYWRHGGDILGFKVIGGTTASGSRQATVMVNLDPGGPSVQKEDMQAAVETALCG